ncbi:MAG: DUF4097 family beta strand repeat-containing protein [candidate division Zixibacteria bacterium]
MRTWINKAITIALVGLISGAALAQEPLPPAPDPDPDHHRDHDLTDNARDAADEYLEVLQELEIILADYFEYFYELDPIAQRQFTRAFDRFAKSLEDGSFRYNSRRLAQALDEYKADLKREQHALSRSDSKKLKRMLRGLGRELESVSFLLQEELLENLEQNIAQEKALQKYLISMQMEEMILSEGQLSLTIKSDSDGAITILDGDKHQVAIIYVPDFDPSDLPDIPDVPDVVDLRGVLAPRSHHNSGLEHTFSESARLGKAGQQILILQPTGDVRISRNKSHALKATLFVEVSAGSRSEEKAFIDQTTLTIESGRKGYQVKASFPKLRNARTKLLRAELDVRVPNGYPVACENSFGKLVVCSLRTEVSVEGHHSEIDMFVIEGMVEATNDQGSIFIGTVVGEIEANSSHGRIEVEQSTGSILIESRYGNVSVDNCQGDLTLTNSGEVEVGNHFGTVMIDNRNGEVLVSDVVGELIAFNAYRPLIVNRIDGNARLENASAMIQATQIGGELTINNQRGHIIASELAGPIDFTSEYGTIEILLDDNFQGDSQVWSESGDIFLKLAGLTDLVLEAEALDGKILSKFPMTMSERGDRKLGKFKLGDGSVLLELSTTNSSILIEPAL